MRASATAPGEALLQDLIWPGRLPSAHLVMDAARAPSLYGWLARSGLRYASLYSGTSAVTLQAQAPYLVELPLGSPVAKDYLRAGWGFSAGIFVFSDLSFESLRIALKKKLVLRDPHGQRNYFRFYDPRVAIAFLATGGGSAWAWWFAGPLSGVLFENLHGQAVLCTPGTRVDPIGAVRVFNVTRPEAAHAAVELAEEGLSTHFTGAVA